MISIDESCLKCFDNFLNFNASNHFVNKCVNKYHKRFIFWVKLYTLPNLQKYAIVHFFCKGYYRNFYFYCHACINHVWYHGQNVTVGLSTATRQERRNFSLFYNRSSSL